MSSSSSREIVVCFASGDGDGGSKAREDAGSNNGVLTFEDMADGGSTRLARRKVKKAVVLSQSCLSSMSIAGLKWTVISREFRSNA